MGQDELGKAVRERPDKVLDAIREMCDHYADIASEVLLVPLGTQDGVVRASMLQGRALALQTLLGVLFDKLTETEDPDDNLNPNSERR